MKEIDVYIVSDSTGETVLNVSRAALSHFENIEVIEHTWSMVRTKLQIDKLIDTLKKRPGIVLFTLMDSDHQHYLRDSCSKINVLAIPVLSEIVSVLSTYLNKPLVNIPGRKHALNEEYYSRINAINYAIAHDDGQSYLDISKADIILVGPSRTSKSPTSIYLAYRGYKTANIPYVLDQELPNQLFEVKKPLIIGLWINPESLVEIRKNRLANFDKEQINYTNFDTVREELLQARKLYKKNNWPIIDVSKKSVEETATSIINFYENRNIGNCQ